MSLTKDQILQANDRQLITVDCPEWGGDVCMLPLSGVGAPSDSRYSVSASS